MYTCLYTLTHSLENSHTHSLTPSLINSHYTHSNTHTPITTHIHTDILRTHSYIYTHTQRTISRVGIAITSFSGKVRRNLLQGLSFGIGRDPPLIPLFLYLSFSPPVALSSSLYSLTFSHNVLASACPNNISFHRGAAQPYNFSIGVMTPNDDR